MAGSATDPSTATSAPSGAALREQIIAEMSGSGSPADEAPKAEPATQPAEEKAEEVEADAAPVETADSEEETDVGVEDDEDEDAAPADPETVKRLDVVRRAEKRMRAQVEAKEAELAAREQKLSERLSRADEIERLAARAKYDPAAVFRALGLTDDDFEMAAQALYSESKAGQADPKRKEAAARLLREREHADKLTAIEKRALELEQKLERQKLEAAAQAEAARYFEQMNQAATTAHPLVAHLLKADPNETAQGLVASYDALSKKGVPKPAAVVKHFEAQQRARFKRLGIDPDVVLGKTTETKAAPKVNGKPAPAPANSNSKPSRDELIAELASLSD